MDLKEAVIFLLNYDFTSIIDKTGNDYPSQKQLRNLFVEIWKSLEEKNKTFKIF